MPALSGSPEASRASPKSRMKGLGHVGDDGDLLFERHPPLGGAERLALDELHRDVRVAVRLADLVDLADVLVADSSLRSRLCEQPSNELGVVVEDELDRDVP